MRERRRKKERVETKGERTRRTSSLVRELLASRFSLSLSLSLSLSSLLSLFLSHSLSRTYAERDSAPRRTRSFARSETKLVAFRGTRDGADGGDGGTAGQKRITRVITTLINK